MLNICLKSKKKELQARINASRVMERFERMNILGGQNNESVKDSLQLKSMLNDFKRCKTINELK